MATAKHDEGKPTDTVRDVADAEAAKHAAEAAKKPEPPKPEHPLRSALKAALRNAGHTADQAEGVVKALEDYLSAGAKH